MSMISPEAFIDDYKDRTYEELIPIRDELIDNIRLFEKNGDFSSGIQPSPSTIYQVHLEYLGKLFKLIADKYRDLQWEVQQTAKL